MDFYQNQGYIRSTNTHMEGTILAETIVVVEKKPIEIIFPYVFALDSLNFRVRILKGGEKPVTVLMFKPLLTSEGTSFVNTIVIKRDETDEFSFCYNHSNKAVRTGAKIRGVEFRTLKDVVVKFEVFERNSNSVY